MEKYLGMYVHMHWAYGHPYAARTWTVDDWRNYAGGLSKLGYNLMMIWPITETMPDPPTPSDVEWLERLGKIIDMLHGEFGMHVIITLGPNTVGNAKARQYEWAQRPFFETDSRLDPSDREQMDKLINHRRNLLRYLSNADGFSIIDSDPGGYIGSTNDEFADLMWRHLAMLREMNPEVILYYWMWVGWESYNRFWERAQRGEGEQIVCDNDDYRQVLARMKEWPSDSWRLFSCRKQHQEIVEEMGLQDKALFYPYGLIEGEPTFPFTNCNPERIRDGLQMYRNNPSFLGAIGNSQTHAVQAPGAYMFSRFATGGSMDDLDLPGFADRLVRGQDSLITGAWEALAGQSAEAARELVEPVRETAEGALSPGDCSGLLLRTPREFLFDLAMQLDLRADSLDFAAAVARGEDWKQPMKALVNSWGKWMDRTGFADACGGPVIATVEPALRELKIPEIDAVLAESSDWRHPELRHGVIRRLVKALRTVAG